MLVGAAATHFLIPETSDPNARDEVLGRRPRFLDICNTGFLDSRRKDQSLEELHVTAETRSRAQRDRITGWFNWCFRTR